MRGYEHFAQDMEEVYKGVRDSAYEIIERKGATYYGIGMAAEKIVEATRKKQSYGRSDFGIA